MKRTDSTLIANRIATAIRIGGTAVGVVNPIIGASVIGMGEILPVIVENVNKSRGKIFINSVESENNSIISTLDYEKMPEVSAQIIDTVRKAMLSESNYTIFVMGKIAANALMEKRRYTQNELQLIDALYRMNDYDFINFMHICNQFDEIGKKSVAGLLIDANDLHDEANSSRDNLLFSLKKLSGMNLFDYCSSAMFEDADFQTYYSSDFYKMNTLTDYLLDMINQIG